VSEAIAGWHGKLPSLGDFASRRLDADFIAHWDGWLAAGLAQLQRQSPADWLQHYLACPAWRFVLMPGMLPAPFDDRAWAGVLMPSVDRIGRYFPLTLVAPLAEAPRGEAELRALLRWLHDLDDLAADALQDDWPIERLEAELAQCPRPGWDVPATPTALLPAGTVTRLHAAAGADAVVALLAAGQAQAWRQAAAGHAFWWADGQSGAPRLLVTRGLPSTDDLRLLFGTAPAAP
jgi:type VI secretion system protein ImpM